MIGRDTNRGQAANADDAEQEFSFVDIDEISEGGDENGEGDLYDYLRPGDDTDGIEAEL